MSIIANGKKIVVTILLIIAAFFAGFLSGRYPNRSGISDSVTIYQKNETELTTAGSTHNQLEGNLIRTRSSITTSRTRVAGSIEQVRTIRSGLEGIESLALENTALLAGIEQILLRAETREQSAQE
jgi:hypothetical protein